MRPTDVQVQRSLEALHDAPGPEPEAHERSADDVPAGVLACLSTLPATREDRVEEVRRDLEDGVGPSADELAQRMVGRMVCDRLR